MAYLRNYVYLSASTNANSGPSSYGTNEVASSNLAQCKMFSIKFVSDLREVGGFLRFPPPIKLKFC